MHDRDGRPAEAAPVDRPGPPMARRTALGMLGGGLALGSLTVLSGCTLGGRREPLPPVHEPTPGVDPDVVVAGDTLGAEQAMLDAVNATIARHPGLQAMLEPVAAVHQAHVRLLVHASPGSPTTPSPGPSASPTTTGADASTVPRHPDRALRRLARHEDRLSLYDKQQAFTARSGAFARLLASMAAAAAQQSVQLGRSPTPHHGGSG